MSSDLKQRVFFKDYLTLKVHSVSKKNILQKYTTKKPYSCIHSNNQATGQSLLAKLKQNLRRSRVLHGSSFSDPNPPDNFFFKPDPTRPDHQKIGPEPDPTRCS